MPSRSLSRSTRKRRFRSEGRDWRPDDFGRFVPMDPSFYPLHLSTSAGGDSCYSGSCYQQFMLISQLLRYSPGGAQVQPTTRHMPGWPDSQTAKQPGNLSLGHWFYVCSNSPAPLTRQQPTQAIVDHCLQVQLIGCSSSSVREPPSTW